MRLTTSALTGDVSLTLKSSSTLYVLAGIVVMCFVVRCSGELSCSADDDGLQTKDGVDRMAE